MLSKSKKIFFFFLFNILATQLSGQKGKYFLVSHSHQKHILKLPFGSEVQLKTSKTV